jgi:hypothetical protein
MQSITVATAPTEGMSVRTVGTPIKLQQRPLGHQQAAITCNSRDANNRTRQQQHWRQ